MFIIYVGLFIMGIVLTSFYGVVAMRLPREESIVKPRSYCDNCKHTLAWYELFPILSYILMRGKCIKCHKHICILYPISELLGGLLFCFSFYCYGFTYNTLIMLILSSLLLIIFISDFKYFIILDSPLIISSILIFIIKLTFLGIKQSLISLLCGFIMVMVMILIRQIGNALFKRESLGIGDIKLVFIFGLVLGFKISLLSLILASLLALPYAIYLIAHNKKEQEMPFGPFLILSLYISFAYLNYFTSFYNFLIY